MAHNPAYATVTIAGGASLSDAFRLEAATIVGVTTPSGWTTAAITWQVSVDGSTYVDLLDSTGTEISAAAVAASKAVATNPDHFLAWRYVKVRSGTAAAAVAQAGGDAVTIVYRHIA